MKAIVCTKYGTADVLQLRDIERPAPKSDEVLIKVHAASLNATDVEILRGMFLIRIAGPLRPMYKVLGSDIAGRVEAVGGNATQLQQGDEVLADLSEHGFGAFAEYVCVPEHALTHKPAGITFEEAAALPQAGLLALQGIRDKGQVQPGHKVLINGAGGGVGTFAVQIAKLFGAEVTGVDNARKLDMMRSIGADQVIDYTREDFTKNGQRYDLILDVVGRHSIFDYKRGLSSEGIYAMVGGSSAAILKTVLLGSVISRTSTEQMGILMGKPNKMDDLLFMLELLEAGKVAPIVDRTYPLSETAEAFRYLEEGRAQGKLVITMDNN